MSIKQLDAVIFAATGFSGKYLVEDAVEMLKDFRWAIAGRSETKLRALLSEVGTKLEKDLSKVPVIVADVKDEDSIKEMAKKCKIVLNCCGPFHFYGETVVKACVEAGTHHIDMTGELQYIDKMHLKYHDLAQEKKCYVVPSCALLSVVADMGVVYAKRNFPGTVNSVEMYWENKAVYKDPTSKVLIHTGTWESIIFILKYFRELSAQEQKVKSEQWPSLTPKLRTRRLIHTTKGLQSYFIPVALDKSTVRRSQRLLYAYDGKRPVQFTAYMGFSLLWAIFMPFYILMLTLLAQFGITRRLLLKYPNFFSFGVVSQEGPTKANRGALQFIVTFKAKGWSEGKPLTLLPDRSVVVRVSGNDTYVLTSKCMLACTKIILKESDHMPGSGGVLTPGAAFAKTQLIEELSRCEDGLTFEIVAED